MTTETFSDYVAQQDARNTIQLNVRKWTLMLCDALRQNYINYSIDSHERSIYLADAGDSFSTNYHQSCICLLYTSPSPRDKRQSRMPSSA